MVSTDGLAGLSIYHLLEQRYVIIVIFDLFVTNVDIAQTTVSMSCHGPAGLYSLVVGMHTS